MQTTINPQQPHVAELKTEIPAGTFEQFAALCRETFDDRMRKFGPHLVRVEFEKGTLNEAYLGGFEDAALRQHHNCSACRHFIDRYGQLAFIKDGELIPAIWPVNAPGLYDESTAALYKAVAAGKVEDVFLSGLAVLGTPVTGEWNHFAVNWETRHKHRTLSAGQVMAEKREHFGTMFRALIDYDPNVVRQALSLCEADQVFRQDKIVGALRFLKQAMDQLAPFDIGTEKWNNTLWKIVAEGHPGVLTPRSSVTGTLLDDLMLVREGSMTQEAALKRFEDKMSGLNYMRPKAAPSLGQIAEANKLVDKLGLTPSLERRNASVDEVPKIWQPSSAAKWEGDTQAAFIPITFEKLRNKVLPTARHISVRMGYSMALGAYVTAVHADAPPILRYDREDARNPLSWYLYQGGSAPKSWGLTLNAWVECVGIGLRPELLNVPEGTESDAKGAMLLLRGARDVRRPGPVLFPELLRGELTPIRKTIEQRNNMYGALGDIKEPHASGVIIGSKNGGVRIRVETDNGPSFYTIDRWD